jgi:polysaccharide export outer membrane protein
MKARWLVGTFLIMTLAVPGCSSLPKEVLEEGQSVPNDFLLGPEDVLDVVVWRNQDLSKQVVVRPDGLISLPLIGDVRASGLTAEQLVQRIGERLKEFKESPSVSVSVREVNSYQIYVLGEVSKPGKYSLKSYTTVLQAIATAGGFTQFASKNKIQVLRNIANGNGTVRQLRMPVRYDDLVAGKGEIGNFLLKSGDTLVVP